MKYRRRTALAAALCMIVCTSLSASAATYDMDGDRNITVFDLVLKKREMMENPDSYALYDMLMIDSHILGLQNIPLYEPDETTTAPAPQWIIEPKHTVHTGQATYYTIGSGVGYYDLNTFARNNGLYTCAFNKKDFTLPIPAGAYLRVTNQKNGSSVDVYVVDASGQSKGSLDLDKSAFQQISALSAGRLNISWEIIPYPTDAPMLYSLRSSQLQILQHKYPIYSLEKRNADGSFSAVTRNVYGFFTGLKAGQYTFRITDIYGNIVVDTVTLVSGQSVAGNYNFPE